jgi:hypothetical protein
MRAHFNHRFANISSLLITDSDLFLFQNFESFICFLAVLSLFVVTCLVVCWDVLGNVITLYMCCTKLICSHVPCSLGCIRKFHHII